MAVFILLGVALVIFILIVSSIKVISQRTASIVERLGKYKKTLNAGFHVLIPFLDKVTYKHTLKEKAIDVPSQTCITKDNISISVDGVLYLQVIDPQKASYGIDDYLFASIQIAQTTMRSIVGKLDLDKTFEERDSINSKIVDALDSASNPWGVKITRYEISNIVPPQSIKDAMEKQMRAEREKRAVIAESEGEKQAKINRSEGDRQELILRSEGKAKEIESIAIATAVGIEKISQAISKESGKDAMNLRIAEQYIGEFGKLAKENNTMIIPSNLTDIAGIIATATKVMSEVKNKP